MKTTKIFDHAVIYNGVFYPANTPIPAVKEKTSETDVETPATEGADGKTEETVAPETEQEAGEKAGKANANKGKGRKPKTTSKSAK